MAGVNLTAALRSNLLSLQGTQRLLDQTQLRLATGLKVNSALDNPTAFFGAQSLNNRASDLGRLLDGIGQAVQTLKTVDEGIKSLTNFLEQAQAIAQEARDQAVGGAVVTGSVELTAAQAADLSTVGTVDALDTFTIRLGEAGSPTTTFTISDGQTLQDLADEISAVEGLSASIIDGSGGTDDTVSLRIQSTNGEDITITDVDNTPAAQILGAGAGVGTGLTAATNTAPTDQIDLQSDFNNILSQIDSLVEDAGYRGVNLLNSGNLTVYFNEDQSSSINLTGVDFSASGLGVNQAAGAEDFSTVAEIDARLAEISNALNSVRSQSRTYGTNLNVIKNREEFTNNLITTLQEGADKLVLADKNEEGANLLALQTAQQLGITSLSLASQANQSVLRLFG